MSDKHDFELEEKSFFLNGEEYDYFLAYGKSGLNERIVELPLISKYLNGAIGKNILEVGAVVSLILPNNFDVVDLTEEGDRILNVNILDFHPDRKYGLIFSISTIEHFGNADYGDIKDYKILMSSLKHIISLLDKGGKFVATAPMGWNVQLDCYLLTHSLPFQEIYYMKRVSAGVWKQVSDFEAIYTKYHYPFPYANAIMLGIYTNNH